MKTIKPKPTRYKNIVFRSKSEAKMAFTLDLRKSVKWLYEPSGFPGEWTPDFAVWGLWVIAPFLVEYKPAEPTEEYIAWWKEQATKIVSCDTGMARPVVGCFLTWGSWHKEVPHFQVFECVARKTGHRGMDNAIEHALWDTFNDILGYEVERRKAEANDYRFDLA